MVFKRRDSRPVWRIVWEFIYPRGGWSRAVQYIRHRLNRLPDPPERIARGIFVGVFTTFTPLYGLHFLLAFLLARIFRGNVIAALMATFFGNPLTYLPIAAISMRTGYWILGEGHSRGYGHGVMRSFARASDDLWDNFKAIFTDDVAKWGRLHEFYEHVFLPFLVGGILPGLIAGAICYYLSVPVIRSYQKRRIKKLRERIRKHRRVAHDMADGAENSD